MQAFGPHNATAEVLTFKEGFLSPIAHDLRIQVQQFEVEVEDGEVRGDFDLSSLVVISAQKDGVDEPGAIRADEKKKILITIQKDVLHTQRYPDAHFTTNLNDLEDGVVEGELELHGETHDVRARIQEAPEGVRVSVDVRQPDFGIKPYTAMFGTLRVREDVIIEAFLKGVTLEDLGLS